MPTPAIGQRVRFTDRYNGIQMEGRVVAPHPSSHFDHPVWMVRVTKRDGHRVEKGPMLSAIQTEINEVFDP